MNCVCMYLVPRHIPYIFMPAHGCCLECWVRSTYLTFLLTYLGGDQEIWLQKQDLGHLVERLETLPEACRFWNDFWSKKSLLENQFRILKCGITGGCCGRGCQCCDKPRRTAAGEAFSYWAVRGGVKDEKDIYAHCTKECGCCRRYWGFSRVIREDDGSLTCIK
jgi:hypothetical protein